MSTTLETRLADEDPLTAKEFARFSPVRPWLEMSLTWGAIVAIEAAYLAYPRPWLFAVAFVLIACQQYRLLVLMHDAFHSILHPSRRVNDLMGAWLIGAPCGSSYWGSRSSHLEHHRKLGNEGDPDLFLYSAGAPRDKRTFWSFARHFTLLMLGEQVLYTYVGGGGPGGAKVMWRRLRGVLPSLIRVAIAQLTLLGLFGLVGSWTTYLTLWVLPLLTLTVLFNGLRVFCDHANLSDEPGDEAHRLVSYISNPLECFFLAPFHMNFHAEHHLFPYVPHYSLPGVRRKLRSAVEYGAAVQWRSSYLRFIREFLHAQK